MDTSEQVEHVLKNYHEIKRSMDILDFEIKRFIGQSHEEVIANMNFSKQDGERVSNSNISDKTSKIAMIYREIADNQNEEILKGMIKRYCEAKADIDLIEYCVDNLEERLSNVVEDMFFNKYTWTQMCDKYYISHAMIGKYRKKAILDITKMYEMKQSIIS